MAGSLKMSKIRIQNTFMSLPVENEYTGNAIYKSLSMPAHEEHLRKWYVYDLPSFEDRENWKVLQSDQEDFKSANSSTLKPASMFMYSQELDNPEDVPSNATECIPLDEHGNLTSIGSVGHLIGMCKPCAFNKHRTKTCNNGLRCSFCHFEHTEKRRGRGKASRNH